MTAWLDKLNLSPGERRLVLIGVVLIALLLNRVLIWPYFQEWAPAGERMDKAKALSAKYMAEINNKAKYEQQLKSLQGSGATVIQEEQANRVQQTIYNQAGAQGVQVNNLSPIPGASRSAAGTTNQISQFFDEVRMRVEVTSGERELIDFLYALGTGDSNIRVRDLTNLRLDPSKTRLQCTLGLAASFQKKPAETKPVPAVSTNKPRPGVVTAKGPSPTNRPPAKTK